MHFDSQGYFAPTCSTLRSGPCKVLYEGFKEQAKGERRTGRKLTDGLG